MFYKLDENKKVVLVPREEWEDYNVQNHVQKIKQESIENYFISTIFFGLDYNFYDPGKPPIVFETIIFKDNDLSDDTYQNRCSTYEEALQVHEEAKKWLYENVILKKENG